MTPQIVMLETVHNEALELLQASNTIQLLEVYNGYEPVFNQHVHAIITRGKGQVDKKLLSLYPNLKVVARCGVGLDNVDIDEASRLSIKVVNAPGSNSQTIAEHTITLMLLLQRNLIHSINEVAKGNWASRNAYTGDEVNGKVLGILGLGNIGQKVASIASALGMRVFYWDVEQKSKSPYAYRAFEEILRTSDVLTLHVPLLDSTQNLINAQALSIIKKGALLINTARGGVIDQKALIDSLESGHLGGFAADVLAVEPPEAKEKLLGLTNTLITPHVGSLTKTTYRLMCVQTIKNVLSILEDKPINEQNIFNHKDLK